MVTILALAVIAFIVANAMGRGALRSSSRADLAAHAEVNGRLARMEEAIQVMASEIERLRSARERDEYYLSARAETPRALPNSENDNPPA